MERYLGKQGKNADALWWFASGRGGKWPGSLPDTPWLSDLWRPRCMSSSSAMQQDVCSLPLTAQPRRTESGVVSVMLTLPQPHCRDSRLLPHSVGELLSSSSKPNFLPTKVKKKQKTAGAVKLTRQEGSLCVFSLSYSCSPPFDRCSSFGRQQILEVPCEPTASRSV